MVLTRALRTLRFRVTATAGAASRAAIIARIASSSRFSASAPRVFDRDDL